MYICRDLYRDIIRFVPLEDLRLLSKASPIFDHEIHALGINIFYEEGNYGILRNNGCMVIQLSSGKKDVLNFVGNDIISTVTGNSILLRDIVYGNNVHDPELNREIWIKDHDANVAILLIGKQYIFNSNPRGERVNNFYTLKIGYKIIDGINRIDLVNKLVLEIDTSNMVATTNIEHFKVIYQDGHWIK